MWRVWIDWLATEIMYSSVQTSICHNADTHNGSIDGDPSEQMAQASEHGGHRRFEDRGTTPKYIRSICIRIPSQIQMEEDQTTEN